jgi:hypothetical protein
MQACDPFQITAFSQEDKNDGGAPVIKENKQYT